MLPFGNMMLASTAMQSDNTAEGGQALFTTPGVQYWTVPEGIYVVAAVLVGAGSNGSYRITSPFPINGCGGGGGHLRWINNIPVTPGEILTIEVGAPTAANGSYGTSSVIKTSDDLILVRAKGGDGALISFSDSSTNFGLKSNGSFVGGGNGASYREGSSTSNVGGAGGAGGYSGNGSRGSADASTATSDGSGGAGSGARGRASTYGYGGGGVGLYGEGPSGIATTTNGSGGSSGANGIAAVASAGAVVGALYGGGGAGFPAATAYFQKGGPGAVRILWGKGPDNGGRAFPSTRVETREGHAGNADVKFGLGADLTSADANTSTGQSIRRPVLVSGISDVNSEGNITGSGPVVVVRFPETERYVTSIVVASNVASSITGFKIEKRKAGVWTTVVASQTYSTANQMLTVAINDTVEAIAFTKSGFQLTELRPIY